MNDKQTLGAPDPPSRPQGPLLITEVTNDSVSLEWNPSESDGGSKITRYLVEVIMQSKKDCDSKDITKYKNSPLPGNGDGYCMGIMHCGFVNLPEINFKSKKKNGVKNMTKIIFKTTNY